MPEPASAFSVRRESKTAEKLTWPSTSPGTPRRPIVWSSSDCTGAARTSPVRSVEGRSARGTSENGGRAGDAVQRRREPGRAGGRAERVQHLHDRLRLGVDQVEGLAVAVGQVGQVVHRRGDVVDRDDVGVAEVDADQRQPGRQVVPHQLQQREEVVGPVDLVHRAGLGVADHDGRPVDPPRHRAPPRARCFSDSYFVRWYGEGRCWPSSNIVSSKRPVVVAGGGDRGDLVEAARLQRGGQLEGVAGAADVHRLVGGVVGGHVVDRGEVEEVVDRRRGARRPTSASTPRPASREVADDRHDPVGAPPLDERLHPGQRALAARARRSRPRGGRRAPGPGDDR